MAPAKGDGKRAGGPTRDQGGDEALAREVAGLSYEDALEQLEAIIERIEGGEVGLEATLSEYRRGQALLRRCRAILETAETEIRQLSLPELEAEASADGGPVSDAPRRGRRGETT